MATKAVKPKVVVPARKPAIASEPRGGAAARDYDVHDLGLAEGGRQADPMGRRADARAQAGPREFHPRAAAQGHQARRLPPYHLRNRQPAARAQGRRRGSRLLRFQPAFDPGRRCGGARQGVWNRDLCDPGRGSRHLLQSSARRPRASPVDNHGRRRRPGESAPQRICRAGFTKSPPAWRRPPPG